ncbi:MAG: cation transporter [Anaerolineales bacterium]|nr:cation transporter [Anaerolineales bacterium]MCB0027311.1 cation transporter [Anaerolineales bacterium]
MAIERVRLKITGAHTMHCRGCERSAEFLLSTLSGVEEVTADHKTQQIDIAFDAKHTTLGKLQEVLHEIDYQTTPVSL